MSGRPTLLRTLLRARQLVVLSVLSLIASLLALPLQAGAAQAAVTPELDVKVNFQPDGSAVPTGFSKDIGSAFTDGAGSGWVRQDSLSGTHVPYAVPLNTRDRNTCASLTPQQRTFIHLQAPSTSNPATNDMTPVAWERVLPNGFYEVTLGVGDANKGNDGESHTLNVEGVNAITAFPGSGLANCNAARLTTATVTVPVTDGRLTVDALGGTNTKLEYVTIRNAPNPVVGLAAAPTATAVGLDWADAGDAASFRVFRGTHLPVATTGAPLATVTASDYSDPSAVKGQVYYYAVQASGANGARSAAVSVGAMIDDAQAKAATFPVSVNFGKSATVDGYQLDNGQNFANVRGYGWVTEATPSAPLDLVGNGRDRGDSSVTDKRLDSLVHMQANSIPGSFNGIKEAGAWELAVPDGSYDVTLAVGDSSPGGDTTNHVITVEGTTAIAGFPVAATATGDARFSTATVTGVAVSDGRLTVSAAGGTNTKLDYVVVSKTPVDAEAPAAPAGVVATAGNGSVALAWTANGETDLAGYAVYRSTEAIVDVTGTPISGDALLTAAAYSDATAANGTAYSYAVVAVDTTGNRSAASEIATATPTAPADTQAPAAPADVVATAGDGSVSLSWTLSPDTDVAGYAVYRSTDATVDVTGTPLSGDALLTDPSYSDTTAVNDTSYSYAVVAVDTAGNRSAASAPVTATPVAPPVACAPRSTLPCAQVSVALPFTLSFDGTAGGLLDGAGTGTGFTMVDPPSARLTDDAPVGVPAVPGYEPSKLTVTPNGLQINATKGIAYRTPAGSANTNSQLNTLGVGVSATGQVLEVATTVRGMDFPTGASKSEQGGLWFGLDEDNYVKLAVVNGGTSTASNVAKVQLLREVNGAASPSTTYELDSATFAEGQDVRLVLHVDAVGHRVSATYQIAGGAVTPLTDAKNTVSTTDQPLASGLTDGITLPGTSTPVSFAGVYGTNRTGTSGGVKPVFADFSVTPAAPPADTTAPAAPTGLGATAGDARVSLAWTAPADTDLAGYAVFRGTGSTVDVTGIPLSGIAPVSETSYTDLTAINGTQYAYVVLAVDTAGNRSVASETASATPADTTAPASPTGVTAAAGDGSVVLSWTANTDGDLAGYRVFRSEDGVARAEVTTAVLTTATFTDSTAVNGTAYTYDVVAVDSAGNRSSASALVTATPVAPPVACTPRSTLPCAQVSVALPFTLSFDGTQGGLLDAAGTGTGFTMVDPPSARLTDDAPVGVPTVPGYEPSKLTVTPNGLQINATKGIAYRTPKTPANGNVGSDNTNSQLNTLGVGVPAAGQVLDIATTVRGMDMPSANNSEQGGLWFGVDEDNYVKLAVVNGGGNTVKVQLLREEGALASPGTTYELDSATFAENQDVRLVLHVDAVANRVSATYQIASGAVTALTDVANTVSTTDQPLAAATSNGITLPGTSAPVSFAGVYGTNRNGTSGGVKPVFADFSVTPQIVDVVAPAAPTGVTAAVGDSSVVLSWPANGEDDLFGYRVFRSAEGQARTDVTGTTVTTPVFTDSTAVNGTTYTYDVVAVDQAGNISVPSAVVTATPQAASATQPTLPLDIAFTAVGDAVRPGYTNDSGEAYTPARGYGWVSKADGSPLSLVGNGRTRAERTGVPVSLLQRGLIHLQGQNVLNFKNVTTEGAWQVAVPAGRYTVTVSVGDQPGTATPTCPGPCYDSQHSVRLEGTTVIDRFQATATDEFRTTTATVEVTDGLLTVDAQGGFNTKINYLDVVAAETDAPAAPADVVATPGDSQVSLAWTASAATDLAGYRVYRSATAGGTRTELTTELLTTPAFTDTAVVNQTPYFYVVTAVDTAGNASVVSAEVTATPLDRVGPAAPTGFTATPGVGSVTLTWAANTENDLLRYRVYTSDSTPVALTGANVLGTLQAGQGQTFLHGNLTPGTPRYYVITAEDTLGNESAPSAEVTATPTASADTTAPNAPTGVTATADNRTVTVSWTAVSATDLAGYDVYRTALGLGGAAGERIKLTATPVITPGYVDTDVPVGGTYRYEVTAVDTSNNASAPSTGATVTINGATVNVKINFQPSGPVPAGFTADTGAAFTSGGSGWVREDSLSAATPTPLDMTANTRTRGRTGIDPRLDTLLHMHYGDIVPVPTSKGTLVPGAWEYTVPNGRYQVTVSAGDQPGAAKTGCAAPCYDSVHSLRVEGALALDRFQATAAKEYATGTVTVQVTDGLLTVDALGSTNTKINYLTIDSLAPAGPDTTPPGAPSGFTVLAGDTSAALSWSRPADADVAGYHVYRSTTPDVAPSTTTVVDTGLVETTSFTDTALVNGTRYYYVVTAVDLSGNEGAPTPVKDVTPGPVTAFNAKVNFQDAATTAPAGYLADWGQAYGARTSTGQGTGSTYGWVDVGVSTPLALVGNGRNRNTGTAPAGEADLRRATFVHMQAPANATAGTVTTPGSWEMAVPNGAYVVTVGVGDAVSIDSSHWLNIENQNAIAQFVPTTGNQFATATRTVVVSDGRLTLSPAGGDNSKIDYVDVASFDRGTRPYATAVDPTNGDIGVVRNTSVVTDLFLTGPVSGVSLPTTVTLTRVADGQRVPGVGSTSGGADTVTFLPAAPLEGGTLYRFDITTGAQDQDGDAFLPFSSVFTTVAGGDQPPATTNAAFDKVPSGASTGKAYTSLVVGPDGKLYAGSIFGQIYRWSINPDGSLANEQVIDTVRTHASANGWEGAPNRTVIGLTFDPASTATDLRLWITDNYAYLGQDVPDATGSVSLLTGPNLENYSERIINLPRSIKDHETNSIAFHDGKMYVAQGSMNAMGAAEGTWKKEEHLLSASILQIDPSKLPVGAPLDVATPDLNRPARLGSTAGTYNPYAPGAALKLYATGVRNAYDLVWHSNGHLYAGVNGSAAGGATPATPATYPASCQNRPDGGYTGPSAPQIRPNNQAETDYIFDIHEGKYYGHPNPQRCEYVLNAGNPTGYTGNPLFKTNGYPAGQQADPNYDLQHVYDAGLHASADGAIEYKNTGAFGGSFAGKLVVVRYSANQEIVAFDVAGGTTVSTAVTGIAGFTGHNQPLDITEDVSNGNLYVSQLTNNFGNTSIVLLKPQGGSGPAVGSADVTPRVVVTATAGATGQSQPVWVRNAGNGPLTVTGLAVSGPDAARFTVNRALPVTVAPGTTLSIPVTFTPTVPGPSGATLSVTTSDPKTPTTAVTLRGLGVVGQGGTKEPSLQWILDTLQIPVNVGDPDPTDNDLPDVSTVIGDEVLISSFQKALFDRPVTIEPLSLFGPNGPTVNPNVAIVNAHTTGDVTDKTLLFNGPNTANQQVLPAVTSLGEYDVTTPFGFDVTWPGLGNRVSFSEDALNTWSPAAPHKIRVYPLKDSAGALVPDAYVIAPEDVASGVDFQDAAFIVRNVTAATPDTNSQATVSPSELVFSGVKGSASAVQQVTVKNGGTADVTVNAFTTGAAAGSFTVTGGAQIVAPGASATFAARFTPGGSTVGVQSAALRVVTDGVDAPDLTVGLYGLATNGEQGNNEPPLQAVVDTLGNKIDVGGSGLILGTQATPIGDEILAPLFVKAGTANVGIKAVARYSPDELLPFGWYSPNGGNPVTNQVAVIDFNNEQTLNPAIVAGGATSFDPGASSFGIYVDSNSFKRKSYTQDGLNTGPTQHATRVYPAKDRAGVLVPDTFLVAFEDASNGDYQDYVFLVTGVQLAGSVPGGTATKINFQPAGSTTPAGYVADDGSAYDTTRGRGWVKAGTSTPQNMGTLTRDRGGDAKLGTLILMQPTASQSPNGDGSFELAVPSGSYRVTVGVGDPAYTDSIHTVRVEGQPAVTGFVPTVGASNATGTVTVPVTDGRLTIDAVGGTNSKLQYVDVVPLQVEADTTPPAVSAAVTGRQSTPGSYKGSALVTVTASDSGSGLAGTSYSLDNGPFQTYSAPVTVAAVGSHILVARAIDVAGNVTTALSVSFTVVADAPSTGRLTTENGDGVPFADRLVMSRIQTPETGATVPANVVHDTSVLRVRNTGTGGLNVTGLTFTGPFALADLTALPAFVPANATLDLPVRFNATTIGTQGGLYEGSVTVSSDDARTPTAVVQLGGFWQSRSENNQEPSLAEITKLFGYGTTIVGPGQTLNRDGLVATSGDEVLSPYWLRSDPTQPVRVRQLAAFHTQGNTATFKWFAKGTSSTTNVATHAGVEGQSVLPHRNGSATLPTDGAFSPTTAFGLYSDGESSDPTRNAQAKDIANGCAGPCGHHVRFWPVRDRAGVLVPDTYLMAMDYSGINYDYNDNVYLLSNLRPETAPDPAQAAPLPGSPALQLDFDAARPGTLADATGQGTGFVSTQPNKLDVAPGSSSYDPSRLTLGDGVLAVASAGSVAAGTNGAGDNTLVNGLQLPFDGTGRTFSVTGRVLGPLTDLDAGSEQAAVMLGSDQDNYVKLAAINTGGVPVIELYSELGGVGTTQGAKATLPAAVGTLDLALIADPATGTVRGAYRIDDGSWTLMAATVTLPPASVGRIFALQAKAGIVVAQKGTGSAPFTARYDSFGVLDGDVTGAPAPVQGALYRLNVGGPTYTDTASDVWSPDTGRFSPATAPAEGTTGTPDIAGTDDDTLFRTYRGNVGNVPQAQRVLSYSLPTRGVGTVDVRLLFAERAAGNDGPGKRVFDIEAEGKTVRRGFDIWTAAGGTNTAAVLPINGITVTDGRLDLTLRATADYPAISAIEVLCQSETCPVDTTAPAVPTDLTATVVASPTGPASVDLDWADNTEPDLLGYDVYRSVAGATPTKLNVAPITVSTFRDTTAPVSSAVSYTVRAVDVNENVSADSGPAGVTTPALPVQQPVRVNTGGPAQTVGGLTWSACSSVIDCAGYVTGGQAYAENDTITGIPAGLNNTIFQSEWTGPAAKGARAFGFAVPVQNGRYSVRLHFAELNKFAAGARVFSVDVEGNRFLTDLDVFASAGGADKAIVRTVTTTVNDGALNLDFLANVQYAKVSAIEILPLDSTAPDVVTGLTGGGTEAAATLDWAASTATDLAGYNVYRSATASGTFTKVSANLVTGTSYTDATAPAGAGVFYRVTAVDTSGNESVRSAAVGAGRLTDTTAPAVVTGLVGGGTEAAATVSWSASTAGDLAGYNVYRSATVDGTYAKLNNGLLTATSYTDATAPVGGQVFYRVTAVDKTGNESARSAAVVAGRLADTTAPAVVVGLTGGASTGGNVLAWSASTASDLAGYAVLRSDTPGGTYARLNPALLTATGFTDSSAPEGVARSYRVLAVDQAGNASGPSSTVTVTRPTTNPPPPAPSGDPVRINTGGPTQTVGGLLWSGCTSTTACSGWVSGGFPYAENDTITGIPAGLNNTIFQSEWTGGAAKGARAFGFAVPVANGSYAVRLHFAELNKFSAGKRVFSVDAEGTRALTDLDLFVAAGGADKAIVRSFTRTVSDGVMNLDFLGGVENAKISAIEILPADTTAPEVVTGLIGGGTIDAATLSWSASTATDLAGYNVYRSATETGAASKVNGSLVTGTAYADATAPAGAAQYYRVTAVDSSGNESVRSAAVAATRKSLPTQAVIRVNAGGPAVTTGGVAYEADRYATGGKAYSNPRVTAIAGTTDDLLYRTEHSATANLGGFSYAVPVADGTYDVTLHFAEIYWGAPGGGAGGTGRRVFDVNLEGGPVELSALDLNQLAAPTTAVVRSQRVTVTDGVLDMAFSAQVNQPTLSAFEIVPAAIAEPTARTFRINTGGTEQRVGVNTWSACSAVTDCSGWVTGGYPYSEPDTIGGVPAGMNQTVLQSEWTGGQYGPNAVAPGQRAFGFAVPVPDGEYMVKLHFAELNKTGPGQRTFDVRLEGATVLSDFDIWQTAGGIDKEVVRSFPVTISDGAVTLDFIRQTENAKISAIEIIPVPVRRQFNQ